MSAAAPRPPSPGTMTPERVAHLDSVGESVVKPGSKLDDENRSSTGGATLPKKSLPKQLLKKAVIPSTTVPVRKDVRFELKDAPLSSTNITSTTPHSAGLIAVTSPPAAMEEDDGQQQKLHDNAVIAETNVNEEVPANLEDEGAKTSKSTSSAPSAGLIAVPHSLTAFYEERAKEELQKTLLMHPINFEVKTNNANPVKFIQDLLQNLKMVDGTTCILPQPNAKKETKPLTSMDELPRGAARLRSIVNEFIAGLATTATSMKGKVWIQSKTKFEDYKRNGIFKKWLVGSASTSRIQLDISTLSAVVRLPVGIFLNTVTRFDLAESFHDRLRASYAQKNDKNQLPPFQVEVKVLHRNKEGSVKVFRLLAARENVAQLRRAMLLLYPKPSEGTTFIPFDTWNTLTATKKNEYFGMHRRFSGTYSAIKFRGIRTSTAIVMPSKQPGKGYIPIHE